MQSKTWGYSFFILFASFLPGQPLLAAEVGSLPRIRVPDTLAECLRDEVPTNEKVVNDSKWVLTCAPDVFLKKNNVSKLRNPTLSLLVSKALYEEVLKLRAAKLSEPEFIEQSEPLVKECALLLRPLYVDSRSSQNYLAAEAVALHIKILGDAFRFSGVRDLLRDQNNLLNSKNWLKKESLSLVAKWVELSSHPGLRDWYLGKLISLRSAEITGSSPSELDTWLQSLSFAPLPKDKDSQQLIVRKLRALAVAFPEPENIKKINTTANQIELWKKYFEAMKKPLDMTELLIRARAQVKHLNSEGALLTMKKIRTLTRQSYSEDELWDAFQFHVRILRLLDQRPQIPGVIQSYINIGRFTDMPKNPTSVEWQKYFSRLQDIARLYWNYDDPEKALDLLNKIISMNEANKTDYSLSQAMLVKARIVEQSLNKENAVPYFEQALSSNLQPDQISELLWRRAFIHLDIGNKQGQYVNFLKALFDIKDISMKDPTEKARWLYWYGQGLLLNGKKEDALKIFEEAYQTDFFSFYSDLAGLELLRFNQKPEGWTFNLGNMNEKAEEPEWDDFFSETGKLTDATYDSLARVYFLASIGDFSGARRAFGDMDKSVWQIALSTKTRWDKRRRYVRAALALRSALNDSTGTLRLAEVLRQAKGSQRLALDAEEVSYLYPRSFWTHIDRESKERLFDPYLVTSLIRQESAFNESAQSAANAIGLMQMIPPTANTEAQTLGLKDFKVESLFQAPMSIKLGVNHLSGLSKNFEESWICAIAAYNAGSPPVYKWLSFYTNPFPLSFIERIPFAETKNYVRSILRNYINYKRIYENGAIDLDKMLVLPRLVPGKPLTNAR